MITFPQGLTPAGFIAWEAEQEMKHEFAGGSISAFPGGSVGHSAIAAYVAARLFSGLAGTPCKVLGPDVLITTLDSLRYADAVVTCDERDTRNMAERTIRYPKLIVEVLSESTASLDRGPKLREYRTIETLEEYVLIDSRRRNVEPHVRVEESWKAMAPTSSGLLYLTSVDMTLDLDELYEYGGVPEN